jgi:hypothetical protein
MTLTRDELKRLAVPVVAGLVALAAGVALLAVAGQMRARATADLELARQSRQQNTARLERIAEEEREVREKADLYRRLKQLNIVGDENRLEWADAIGRIRKQRELLDLRYVIDRQKLLVSVPGNPANVDFFSSTMKVDLALLHEEDLLRFLSDLRDSGNAYYSVRRCDVERTGQAPSGTTMTPRLRAQCQIDLITVRDRGAKR